MGISSILPFYSELSTGHRRTPESRKLSHQVPCKAPPPVCVPLSDYIPETLPEPLPPAPHAFDPQPFSLPDGPSSEDGLTAPALTISLKLLTQNSKTQVPISQQPSGRWCLHS